MCAAVVPVVRPAKTTSTVIWSVAASHVTIAFPLPDEAVGGFSLFGLKAAVNTNTVSSQPATEPTGDRKSTRLNSSHLGISYAVFCLKKKNKRVRPGDMVTIDVRTTLQMHTAVAAGAADKEAAGSCVPTDVRGVRAKMKCRRSRWSSV